jgi:hypothetical protein
VTSRSAVAAYGSVSRGDRREAVLICVTAEDSPAFTASSKGPLVAAVFRSFSRSCADFCPYRASWLIEEGCALSRTFASVSV